MSEVYELNYTSSADLFRVVEEAMLNDMEMLNYMIETSILTVSLEEAEGMKNKANEKRVNAVVKLFENLKINFMKGLNKIKLICASVKAKMNKFRSTKLDKALQKYEAKFNANKKAATTDKFEMKYDKRVIEFTEKDLAKALDDAIVAGKMISKNTINLARKHTEAINKNRQNIFKVEGLSKYADKFCCCCEEKADKVKGNPFKGSFNPEKLLKELKHGSLDINLEKLVNAMEANFNDVQKQADDAIKLAKGNVDKISADDLAIAGAANAIISGTIKAYAHAINDIIREERLHLSECIKIFIGVANMRSGVNEAAEMMLTPSDASLFEAELLVEDMIYELEKEDSKDE